MTATPSASASENLQAKQAQLFAKYLADRKVLIVDPSASSRTGLFKVLHDLGAPTANLTLVNTFEHAQEAIVQNKPHLVITEYELDKRCGLELLQAQRAQRPEESKQCLFIIVTGNTSQTAVARSAEEDIDAYVLKPFTPNSVRRTLMQAAIHKIKPPAYFVALDEGKALLAQAQLDEAEKVFEHALTLDPAPSLAYYYLGQIKFMRKVLDESKGKYKKGLEFNQIHYRCLVGLYDLLMQQNQHREAYEVVKKVSQYFPANPKRLTEVLRLAVVTGQFADIEQYYATFTNIDERNDEMVRYVCAAMVVGGKHFLSTGVPGQAKALELFKKAAATAQGRTHILREIVLALVEYGLVKDAHPFMERFPLDAIDTEDFLVLRFLIANAENKVADAVNQGRALMARGMGDVRFFEVMIRRSVETKAAQMALDEILSRAAEKFPDKKAHFEQLLRKEQGRQPAA